MTDDADNTGVRRRRRHTRLGMPSSPKGHRGKGLFADPEMHEGNREAMELAPPEPIDQIVSRYAGTGSRVPLDEAFPDAPGRLTGNPAADRAASLNANPLSVIARDDPGSAFMSDSAQAYQREHDLRMVHRLMLRGAGMPAIATALGCSTEQAYAMRRELYARLRAEAGSIDMLVHTGKTLGFYDEIRTIAMRDATRENISARDKSRLLTVALAAEAGKHRFLQVSGFYDNATLRPADPVSDGDDSMETIRTAMRAMMDPDNYEYEIDQILEGRKSGTRGDNTYDVRVL